MIRACNHSSFPKTGDTPMDQELRLMLRHLAHGRATAADVEEKISEVTTVAVAQQGRAFIDVVTDGMVRWEGPLSHMAQGIDGLEAAEQVRFFDTNFYDRRLSIVGPLSRGTSKFVDDYLAARDVALELPVKPVLPGPVWMARSARDAHYGDLDAAADAFAGILAEEAAALRDAGATYLQVDEPLLCAHPDDLARVIRCVTPIFDAMGAESTTILSTYFGDLSAIAARVGDLPGTHLGLDLTGGDANFEVLKKLPAGRGVVLGMLDARTTRLEDGATSVARLEPFKETLMARDVMIGPNAGMELLPQDQAFDKLLHARYAVEQMTKEWKWES